jgi:4-amino-4-deoxy-L-arabinose transferase-like glycosyltransferase
MAGFLLRSVVLLLHREVMALPQGGADEVGFERMAWTLSQHGREPITAYFSSGARFLAYLGSFIYDIGGREPYVLGVLMVLIGTALIYIAYRAAVELWEDRTAARLVALACALFPQFVQHSALFLRETPAAFCLAVASYSAVRFLKRHSLPQIAWFSLWVFLGALFHSGVIFAAPALLVGIVLVRERRSRRRFGFYAINATAALALIGVIFWVNETGFGLGKFGGSLDEALGTFETQETLDPRGGAAFPEWMQLRGGGSDAWKVPVRYVTFLFSPLIPFMVRSPRHLLGVVDAVLYLLFFWILLRNWQEVRKNRAAGVLLVIMLALFLVYSLGVSNFGTAIRHRAKVAPLLLLLSSGLPALRLRRAEPSPMQSVCE